MIYLKKVGIIAEYNPFHNGHLYHLNKVKEMFPDSFITLVLSASFTERGEFSFLTKWEKTKIALQYNVDLVVELPFLFATQSADNFAYYAISILENLGMDYLIFGSETNDIDVLKNLVSTTLYNKDYDKLVKNYLDLGNSYPSSCLKALYNLTNINLTNSNDLNWWKNVTQYPISATVTLKGLLRPAILMSKVRLSVLFYGKAHISSGEYIINKQVDTIDGNGCWTTLNLVRVDGDGTRNFTDNV